MARWATLVMFALILAWISQGWYRSPIHLLPIEGVIPAGTWTVKVVPEQLVMISERHDEFVTLRTVALKPAGGVLLRSYRLTTGQLRDQFLIPSPYRIDQVSANDECYLLSASNYEIGTTPGYLFIDRKQGNQVWDFRPPELSNRMNAHVCRSAQSNFVGCWDGSYFKLSVWDARTRKLAFTIDQPDTDLVPTAKSAIWSPDERFLLIIRHDSKNKTQGIRLFDGQSGQPLDKMPTNFDDYMPLEKGRRFGQGWVDLDKYHVISKMANHINHHPSSFATSTGYPEVWPTEITELKLDQKSGITASPVDITPVVFNPKARSQTFVRQSWAGRTFRWRQETVTKLFATVIERIEQRSWKFAWLSKMKAWGEYGSCDVIEVFSSAHATTPVNGILLMTYDHPERLIWSETHRYVGGPYYAAGNDYVAIYATDPLMPTWLFQLIIFSATISLGYLASHILRRVFQKNSKHHVM